MPQDIRGEQEKEITAVESTGCLTCVRFGSASVSPGWPSWPKGKDAKRVNAISTHNAGGKQHLVPQKDSLGAWVCFYPSLSDY